MLFPFQNKELNQAQLLVHDNAATKIFRKDYNIPDDVAIERSGPIKEAHNVEGDGNRILVSIWLIHQAGLKFPISLMLKEVMAQCPLPFMQVSINFV